MPSLPLFDPCKYRSRVRVSGKCVFTELAVVGGFALKPSRFMESFHTFVYIYSGGIGFNFNNGINSATFYSLSNLSCDLFCYKLFLILGVFIWIFMPPPLSLFSLHFGFSTWFDSYISIAIIARQFVSS